LDHFKAKVLEAFTGDQASQESSAERIAGSSGVNRFGFKASNFNALAVSPMRLRPVLTFGHNIQSYDSR
jgi:hypothetical protein